MLCLAVDDASGHYSSGYFDGNNYWMGSLTQCSNIIIEDIDRTIELGMLPLLKKRPPNRLHNRVLFFSNAENKQAIRKTGLLDDDGYDQNLKPLAMSFFENPSFRPGFFIIKSVLRGTIISQNVRRGCGLSWDQSDHIYAFSSPESFTLGSVCPNPAPMRTCRIFSSAN